MAIFTALFSAARIAVRYALGEKGHREWYGELATVIKVENRLQNVRIPSRVPLAGLVVFSSHVPDACPLM